MDTRALFTQHAAEARPAGPLGAVVDHLASGTLTPTTFEGLAAWAEQDAGRATFREGLLDLVLLAGRHAVADQALTTDEAEALRQLTTLFRIEEGEFVERRRKELGSLLRGEMQRLVDDGVLDRTESSYLFALQSAFALREAEFLDVACGLFTAAQRRELGLPLPS